MLQSIKEAGGNRGRELDTATDYKALVDGVGAAVKKGASKSKQEQRHSHGCIVGENMGGRRKKKAKAQPSSWKCRKVKARVAAEYWSSHPE
eukprot:11088232-Lingulodinium_polyedra.AAC.1